MARSFVRNLTSGATLVNGSAGGAAAQLRAVAGDLVWLPGEAGAPPALLITTLTAHTRRADKVWRLRLGGTRGGTSGGGGLELDLVWWERDEAFHLNLWISRTGAPVYSAGAAAAAGERCACSACLPACQPAPARTPGPRAAPPPWPPALAEALAYLRGRSETTDKLAYMPLGAGPGCQAAAANFSQLAPAAHETQYTVRDWAGDAGGAGPAGAGGRARHLYAAIYTPSARNGQLVVALLGANALATAGGGGDGAQPWTVLQPHDGEVEIVDLAVSAGHLAVLERRGGVLSAAHYPLPAGGGPLAALPAPRRVAFDDPSYALRFGDQGPFASPLLRLVYSSLTQPGARPDAAALHLLLEGPAAPVYLWGGGGEWSGSPRSLPPFPSPSLPTLPTCSSSPSPPRLTQSLLAESTYDVNMRTGRRALKQRQTVLGFPGPDAYASRLLWATAPDGARVPISLVTYAGDAGGGARPRPRPLLLAAYGAYGSSYDPNFSGLLGRVARLRD